MLGKSVNVLLRVSEMKKKNIYISADIWEYQILKPTNICIVSAFKILYQSGSTKNPLQDTNKSTCPKRMRSLIAIKSI